MDTFSITDCELYWDTRKKISKKDKRELKKEVKALSTTIGKAMQFLKEAALDKAEPTVSFILGGNLNYEMSLWITNSSRSIIEGEKPLFELSLSGSEHGSYLAHFYSEKFGIVLGVMKEEDQFLELDEL
jgi:hypothetical protein